MIDRMPLQTVHDWKHAEQARRLLNTALEKVELAVEEAREQLSTLGPKWDDGMVAGWSGKWQTLSDDERGRMESGFSGYVGQIGDVHRIMVREMIEQRDRAAALALIAREAVYMMSHPDAIVRTGIQDTLRVRMAQLGEYNA